MSGEEWGSGHKSQRIRITLHELQTLNIGQSQTSENKVWSQNTLKNRKFNLAIKNHREYLCHRSQTYILLFHKSRDLKKSESQVTKIVHSGPGPRNIIGGDSYVQTDIRRDAHARMGIFRSRTWKYYWRSTSISRSGSQ